MNNKSRDLVLFVVDRKDWALGTMASEMAESLSGIHESTILSEEEISNNPYRAWRLSREARVIHFLGQYIASGYGWLGIWRRCLVTLAHIESSHIGFIKRLIGMGFRRFVAMSEMTAEAARSAGIEVRHVWRPGVPVPEETARPGVNDIDPSRDAVPVLGFSGRMIPANRDRKGLDLFESVVTQVSRRADIKLRLCGEGGTPLLEKMRENGVTADLVTPGNREEALDFFRTIDIYLCTSRLEGGPLPVIEAMAAGCVVVSTRVGFVPEVINSDEVGIMCPVNSAESFDAALMDLIQNPRKRIETGSRAAEHIKRNWSWGHDRGRITAAYEAVAKDPPTPVGFQIIRALLSFLAGIIFAGRRKR
jgi:glycosyltransferase involved in cell wall biosynthesis